MASSWGANFDWFVAVTVRPVSVGTFVTSSVFTALLFSENWVIFG